MPAAGGSSLPPPPCAASSLGFAVRPPPPPPGRDTHTYSSGAKEPSAPHPSRRRDSFSGFRGVSDPLPPLQTARKLRFLHRWSCCRRCCCTQSLTPRLPPTTVRMRQRGPATATAVLSCPRRRTSKHASRHEGRASVVGSSWRGSRWFHWPGWPGLPAVSTDGSALHSAGE